MPVSVTINKLEIRVSTHYSTYNKALTREPLYIISIRKLSVKSSQKTCGINKEDRCLVTTGTLADACWSTLSFVKLSLVSLDSLQRKSNVVLNYMEPQITTHMQNSV